MSAIPLVDAAADSHDSTDRRSDAELIDAINAGDSDAFEALYHRYRDWVVNLSFRFIGDRELALDVLQETFLYLVKKFPGFRLTAQFKSFLYPAVRNLSIAARQKAVRVQSTAEEQAVLENSGTPGEPPAPGEGLALALRSLPETHSEVLLLRFVDGLSLNEIADVLEIPLGTVKSRMHNALGALRRDPRTRSYFDQ
jgi:RNA polymerase sigma-70 factor (ECF subfamily)